MPQDLSAMGYVHVPWYLPEYEVECPYCKAPPGEKCVTQSGYFALPHKDRKVQRTRWELSGWQPKLRFAVPSQYPR